MKPVVKFIYIILALALFTCCSGNRRASTNLFTTEIPTGYIEEPDDDDDYFVSGISMASFDGKCAFSIVAYLYQTNLDNLFSNNVKKSLELSIPGIKFGETRKEKIADTDGCVLECWGDIDGNPFSGEVYMFEKKEVVFMVLAIGTTGEPDCTAEVLGSITPNEEYIASRIDNPEREIDAVINISNENLAETPGNPDEIRCGNIKADHAAREVIISYILPGSADDYDAETFNKNLADSREEQAKELRQDASNDLLISVPSRLGYSIVYNYYINGEDTPFGSMKISNDELK